MISLYCRHQRQQPLHQRLTTIKKNWREEKRFTADGCETRCCHRTRRTTTTVATTRQQKIVEKGTSCVCALFWATMRMSGGAFHIVCLIAGAGHWISSKYSQSISSNYFTILISTMTTTPSLIATLLSGVVTFGFASHSFFNGRITFDRMFRFHCLFIFIEISVIAIVPSLPRARTHTHTHSPRSHINHVKYQMRILDVYLWLWTVSELRARKKSNQIKIKSPASRLERPNDEMYVIRHRRPSAFAAQCVRHGQRTHRYHRIPFAISLENTLIFSTLEK